MYKVVFKATGEGFDDSIERTLYYKVRREIKAVNNLPMWHMLGAAIKKIPLGRAGTVKISGTLKAQTISYPLLPGGSSVENDSDIAVNGIDDSGGYPGKTVTVIGDSKTSSILDASNLCSVFNVEFNGKLILKNVTLQNGEASGGYGGGIYINDNDSSCEMTDTDIKNCTVPGGQGGAAAPFTPGAGIASGPEGAFGEPAPQVANASLSDDDIEDISAQPTGVMNAVETSALSPLPSAPPAGEPAVLPERRSLFNRDASADVRADDSAPAPSGDAYEPGDSAPAPSGADAYGAPGSADAGGPPEWAAQPVAGGPPRRPTVRIPNAAQGVRTVDTNTGELSEVRPVDDEFDGIDNPQWRILRPEGAQPPQAPEEPQAPVGEEPAPAPAFTPYEPMPEPAAAPDPQLSERPGATAPAGSEAGWSAPAPATSPMSPVSEPPKTSKMGKILLIALVVLVVVVVALVVLGVVWFLLNREGGSSAGALESVPTWTSLLDC